MQKNKKMKGTLKFLGDSWYVVHKADGWYTYNPLHPDDAKLEMLNKRLPTGELAMDEMEVEFEIIEKLVLLDEKHGEFLTTKAKIIIP
jgi:hypothetical protein